ncbi:MAG: hypothetical protein ACJZ6A_00485 [Candidatus Poseidoniaceae archaeon]
MSRTPPLVWGLLVAGVLGVSSAGAILSHVDSIPPLMRASWRSADNCPNAVAIRNLAISRDGLSWNREVA